jgi:hypothetical protein
MQSRWGLGRRKGGGLYISAGSKVAAALAGGDLGERWGRGERVLYRPTSADTYETSICHIDTNCS